MARNTPFLRTSQFPYVGTSGEVDIDVMGDAASQRWIGPYSFPATSSNLLEVSLAPGEVFYRYRGHAMIYQSFEDTLLSRLFKLEDNGYQWVFLWAWNHPVPGRAELPYPDGRRVFLERPKGDNTYIGIPLATGGELGYMERIAAEGWPRNMADNHLQIHLQEVSGAALLGFRWR